MGKKINKNIILILLLATLFVMFNPKNVSAVIIINHYDRNDKKGLYSYKGDAVNQKLRINRDGSSKALNGVKESDKWNYFIQDRASSHIYCIQHNSKTGEDGEYYDYDIKSYISIEGNKATNADGTKTIVDNKNLVLAYLFTKEKDKESDDDTAEGLGLKRGYSGDDIEAARNLAIKHYLATEGWMSGIGSQLGANSSYIQNYNINKTEDSFNSDTKNKSIQLMTNAKNYVNKTPSISTDKSSYEVNSLREIGPIKITYTGTLSSIKLYNGETEVTGTTFKVGGVTKTIDQINSGDNVTIVKNNDTNVTKVEAKSTGEVLKVEMWFCVLSNAMQNLLVTKPSYKDDTKTASATIQPLGSIKVTKVDQNGTAVKSNKTSFWIKTPSGKWLSGTNGSYNYDTSEAQRQKYNTDKNGVLTLSNLKQGTYYIREAEAPTGYEKNNSDQSITISASNLNPNINFTNVEKVTIRGYAWIDQRAGKQDDSDGIWSGNMDGPDGIEGVTVKLMKKGQDAEVATFTTGKSGIYIFKNAVNKADLSQYYVLFDYSGLDSLKTTYRDVAGVEKKYINYIPVTYRKNTGEHSSKALLNSVATNDADLSGIATTYSGANSSLVSQYGLEAVGIFNESTRILNGINLGLKKLPDVDYNITQNLAYVKIDINGYTFTYNYGGRGDTSMIAAPKTNWQKKGTISGYTADIYPSDIAYSVAQTDDNKRIKVYVVYRIDITNTTNYNIAELYKESKLRISSLNNYYDGNRYTLEKAYNLDNNNSVTKDFDDWSEASDTTRNGKNLKVTTYNLDKYKDGIEQDKTITSFIEFRVKDDAIKKILENPNGIIEEYPTEAETKGYHEYTRKDYSWDLNISKDNQSHITPNDTRSSAAPYLIFREHQEKERTIKGIVFEDKAPNTETAVNVEKLGDGIYNSNENVVKGVKVDLIEVPSGVTDLRQLSAEEIKNLQPATRYQKDASGTPKPTNSTIITDNGGNYNLVGVVPGRYFLRYTYGDGTQKICNTSGNEIKTIVGKDYKSTIVKEANAKEALNGGTREEWYKDMDNNVISSVALDNLNTRKVANEAAEGKADVIASTAKMSVTIENNDTTDFNMPKNTNYDSDEPQKITLADSKDTKEEIYAKYLNTIKAENTFNGLSFGIIEAPKQDSEIQKLITNVKLTNTQGNVLYNGNPESVASQGVVALSDLDGIKNGGSTYVRAEMQEESLYGTNLELTYEVEITNKSDINYYNNEYYWYGEKNDNKEVTLTPTDVKDYLDETLTYIEGKSDKNRITSNGTKNITIENNKSVKAQEMDLKGWKTIYTNKITDRPTDHPTSDKVKIVANRLLSNNDDDMEVVSRAEIKDIKHTPDPKDSTPQAEKEEQVKIAPKEVHTNGMVKARFTITPPTGENRSATSIYAIAGIMSLIILSTGIVIIKKKVI